MSRPEGTGPQERVFAGAYYVLAHPESGNLVCADFFRNKQNAEDSIPYLGLDHQIAVVRPVHVYWTFAE